MWALCLPGCSLTGGHGVAAWHYATLPCMHVSYYDAAQGPRPRGQPSTNQDYMQHVVNSVQFSTVISLVKAGEKWEITDRTVSGRIYANSLKQNRPSWDVFSCFMCLQGEVVEFIDEFLDEDKYPTLESPPKHWNTSSKTAPALPSLYLLGFVQGSDQSLCLYLIHIQGIFKFPILCTKHPVEWYGHAAPWLNDFKDNDDNRDRNILTHCFLDQFLHCESCMLSFKSVHFYNEMRIKTCQTSGLSGNHYILQLLVCCE